METKSLKYKMHDLNFVRLSDNVFLFKKGWEVWDAKTDEDKSFKSLDDALAYKPDGKNTVENLIKKLKTANISIDGGRGSSSGSENEYMFGHARNDNGASTTSDFPARINVITKMKTLEGSISSFRSIVDKSHNEHAITVGNYGYATQYLHGGSTSVAVSGGRGEFVIHNHPGGGSFSDSDMYSMAQGIERGIVATYGKGYRILTKGSHFKTAAFVRGVKNAKPKGKNYDDAIDKWLTGHQRKYGYIFKNIKD
jgi:hypothetical protein